MSSKYKSHICKSRSREDDPSSKFRCRRAAYKSFPPALHGTDNYAFGLRQSKQTCTHLRNNNIIVLGTKAPNL